MKRSAARTETRRMVAEPSARFFTSADLSAWVDDAVRNISVKAFCMQGVCTTINTVNTQRAYDYPITMNTTSIETIGIKAVINSSGESMSYVTPDLFGRAGGPGSSYKWTDWGRQILITPTPSAVWTIEPLIWRSVGCVVDNVEFEIPPAFHYLVPLYMTSKAFYKRRSFAAAETYWRAYNEELKIIAMTLSNKFIPLSDKSEIKDQSAVD